MKVYLAVAVPFPPAQTAICTFLEIACQDRYGVHTITDDPDSADLILFVDPHQISGDWRLRPIRQHPLAVKYRHKTMVYDERDQPWRALPGLYVSMPASAFDACRQRACAYHAMSKHALRAANEAPDLLFSFMGSRTHSVRRAIFNIQHGRAHIEDTSSLSFFVDNGAPERAAKLQQQRRRFEEIINRSKFVLCPRGAGTASIRLFEVLSAGRVPVILSDDWVPPAGPEWERCSLRVREADACTLPALLEAAEPRYQDMAAHALQTYHEWFAPDVLFHRMMESCRDILQQSRRPCPAWQYQWNVRYMRLLLRELKAKATRFRRG